MDSQLQQYRNHQKQFAMQADKKPSFIIMVHFKTYAVGIIGGILSKILLFMGDGTFLHWLIGGIGTMLAGALGAVGQHLVIVIFKKVKKLFKK